MFSSEKPQLFTIFETGAPGFMWNPDWMLGFKRFQSSSGNFWKYFWGKTLILQKKMIIDLNKTRTLMFS